MKGPESTMTPSELAEWEAKARDGRLREELRPFEVEHFCQKCGDALSTIGYVTKFCPTCAPRKVRWCQCRHIATAHTHNSRGYGTCHQCECSVFADEGAES